jgi:ribosomal protein L3
MKDCILQIKRPEVDGYSALQIGAFDCTPKNVNKPLQFHFQAAGVAPKRVLKEFPVTKDAVLPVGEAVVQNEAIILVSLIPWSWLGTEIGVRHFVAGQYVDVTGIR